MRNRGITGSGFFRQSFKGGRDQFGLRRLPNETELTLELTETSRRCNAAGLRSCERLPLVCLGLFKRVIGLHTHSDLPR